ncbi:hypothetical protein [Nocardioides sp. GXZ039]|uniref:hypothetical protein n=1 Tax=Nocardioides sp. GXZ039 TaxID=3136018 RepID=UPI0030F40E0B
MRHMRRLAIVLTLLMGSALLAQAVPAPAGADPAGVDHRRAGQPNEYYAELWDSYNPRIALGRDIEWGDLTLDHKRKQARVYITLRSKPGPRAISDVWVVFGKKARGRCEPRHRGLRASTAKADGRGVVFLKGPIKAGRSLNCVRVYTMPTGSRAPSEKRAYDVAKSGIPTDGDRFPLYLEQADMRRDGRIDVVYRGRWSPLRIKVVNTRSSPMRRVTVRVDDPRVEGRRAVRIPYLAGHAAKTVTVQVKVSETTPSDGDEFPFGEARVVASGFNPDRTRVSREWPAFDVLEPGTDAEAGTYAADEPGGPAFTVADGTVSGFSVRLPVSCSGGETVKTVRLPTTAINKYGWIVHTYRPTKNRDVDVMLRFEGDRVTYGTLSLEDPVCYGSVDFTATRTE